MVLPSHKAREVLENVAADAVEALRTRLRRLTGVVKERDAGGDRARGFDIEAEKIIIADLERSLGCIYVVSEELGVMQTCSEPTYIAVVDPVDGSFNYSIGIPWSAVSIALAPFKRGATLRDIYAAVVSPIFMDSTYSFSVDEGSLVNGRRMKPGSPEDVVVGYFEHPVALRVLEAFWKVYGSRTRVRSLGSAALENAYLVATGGALGFMDVRSKLRNVDIAASYAIVKGVGGIITDLGGRGLEKVPIDRLVYGIPILSTLLPRIHQAMVRACREVGVDSTPTYRETPLNSPTYSLSS